MDLSKTLTIYGRKPVLEALQDIRLSPSRLHLANSNKPGGIVGQIEELAKTRAVDIQVHRHQALSRISKNGKQDQGVALDLRQGRCLTRTEEAGDAAHGRDDTRRGEGARLPRPPAQAAGVASAFGSSSYAASSS